MLPLKNPSYYFFSLFKVLFSLLIVVPEISFWRARRKLVKQLKIRHRSNIVNIVVNGPSLQSEDIDTRYPTMCVNQFATSPEFTKIKPNLFLFIDPMYAGPSSKYPEFARGLEELNQNVDWDIDVIVPCYLEIAASSILVSDYIKIYSYQHTSFPSNQIFKQLRRICYATLLLFPPCMNVLIHALYFGMLITDGEVRIYGADFNFFTQFYVDEANHLYLKADHFYGTKLVSIPHKTIAECMTEISISLSAFEDLSAVSCKAGKQVVSYSSASMIDCFKKVASTS